MTDDELQQTIDRLDETEQRLGQLKLEFALLRENQRSNRLEGGTLQNHVDHDPWGPLAQLRLEQGATAAARLRRINFTFEAAMVITSTIYRWTLANAATTSLFSYPIILPTDYILGGFPTIILRYSSTTNTGTIDLTTTLHGKRVGQAAVENYAADVASIAVDGTANFISEYRIKIPVATLPKRDDSIHLFISRAGVADSNNGTMSLYAAYLEYLAFI